MATTVKCKSQKLRVRVHVSGRVQGVGFRPTVYRYAREKKLSGWVKNSSEGLIIEIEAGKREIDAFLDKLRSSPPPRSEIRQISISIVPARNETEFKIVPSAEYSRMETEISPDIATCSECLGELLDPVNRRYLYPFINCTDCGPRFTIVENIPYDRERTTMKKFTMCYRCCDEYNDPLSRRFHAQPNACPDCGPQVQLIKSRVQGPALTVQSEGERAIRDTIRLLKEGKILAIKGLGGFHLACDALNIKAVRQLRARKIRKRKPFALMAKDVEVVKRFSEVSPDEEKLLHSPKSPIVLLKKLRTLSSGLSNVFEAIAPNNKYLGFMLPYTPIHYLLFHGPVNLKEDLSVLVMTSGNMSDDPIIHKNDDAFAKLRGAADYLLVNDRDIFVQCDDSVTRVFGITGKEILVRRSRGYAPEPVEIKGLDSLGNSAVLATGAHLKNTFCLGRGNQFILSQHIGDLENFEALQTYENTIEHFKTLFKITPEIFACDLHPGYLSTKYAVEQAGAQCVQIQHHHAHIASCMADNGLENRKVIGVAFDGTGYGTDGALWGGEFLISDYNEFERVAHLKYIKLPGGEKAIREPWRVAVSLLHETYGENLLELDLGFVRGVNKEKYHIIRQMMDKGVNCPYTSSMGRLFDGISALLRLCEEITYEGEAAILLEMAIRDEYDGLHYGYGIHEKNGIWIIDHSSIIKGVVEDLQKGISPSAISEKFHNTIAELILEMCLRIDSRSHLNDVALSGGVFQNMFLLNKLYRRLTEGGFKVYMHHRVPPNDGGISLGQAVIGVRSCI